jgi:hypothetical protein
VCAKQKRARIEMYDASFACWVLLGIGDARVSVAVRLFSHGDSDPPDKQEWIVSGSTIKRRIWDVHACKQFVFGA